MTSDRVYATDFGNHRVQVFDPEGAFLFRWGSGGAGEGQFSYPTGIAVTERRVFVSDWNNHRVQVFDLEGQFLSQWGSRGQDEGQFQYPRGVCVHNGLAYIVDEGNHRVQVFEVGRDDLVECACPPVGAGLEAGIESLDQD
jgi:DNA-binding beta-propeller fold protein YncE